MRKILVGIAVMLISGLSYCGDGEVVTGSGIYKLGGNIGIGTTAPRAVLDIGNDIGGGKLGTVFGRLSEGDGTGEGTFLGIRGYVTQPDADNDYNKGIKSFAIEHSFHGEKNSSVNFFRGGSTVGGYIGFNTNNNTEKMRITANGNVGIGTSTPQTSLEVNGVDMLLGTLNYPAFYMRDKGWWIGLLKASETSWEDIDSFVFNAPVERPFVFQRGAMGRKEGIVDMMITGGNVIIGTVVTPKEDGKLQVAGNAYINGTLTTKKVVVTQLGWADFVFEPDYKLMPLSDLEKYTKENKHLPDVPTEKEVKEKGVDVGEIQAKLLQKVEEMTLYIIAQEKKNKEQDETIAKLVEENKTLKKYVEKEIGNRSEK